MKNDFSIAIISCLFLGFTYFPTSAKAAPDDTDFDPDEEIIEAPSEAVQVEEDEPRAWFISFGTTTRSINSDFTLEGRQTSLNWRPYVNQQMGRGNVGLYRGGSRAVNYDDGYVRPHNTALYNEAGAAGGYVRSRNQISNANGRSPTERNRILSFHTDDFRYDSMGDQDTDNTSDTSVGVGPYFHFGYHLASVDSLIINFITGGSFIRSDHSSGNRNVANISVMEKRTDYTYQYDYVSNPSLPIGIPGTISGPDQYLVANPSATGYNPSIPTPLYSSGYLPPRQRAKNSGRTVARFYAMSQADLDINLNEIPVGFEIGRSIGPVDIFLTGGTTVNIIDYNLSSRVTWYQMGRSTPISNQRWSESGTPVRVGFYSGIAIKVPLKRNGRVFLEAHGTYRWVDSVNASAGIANVTIDPSSWQSGVGVLIFLD